MLRTTNYYFEKVKQKSFRHWKEIIFQMNRLHPMIAELKLQVLQLQSEIELLQSLSESSPALPAPPIASSIGTALLPVPPINASSAPSSAALLAAERALNK